MSECYCVMYVCIVYVAPHVRVAAGSASLDARIPTMVRMSAQEESFFRYKRGQRERELETLPHHNLQEPIKAQWV